MPERDETALDKLRTEMLTSGLYDWVPMIEARSIINRCGLAESLHAKQDLVLQAMRSLVEDGLMMVGDLPGAGEKFTGWDVTVDEMMEQLRERFIGRYDDPVAWEFSIWLGLTDAGRLVARELEQQRSDGV